MSQVTAGWILLGLVACGGAPAPGAAPSASPVAVASDPSVAVGARSPSGDRHPGLITYEDHVEHRTWTRNAVEVPAKVAWVKVRERWTPVVWIEIHGEGRHREITTYGPNHELLERTTARLAAPPPRIAPPPASAPIEPEPAEPVPPPPPPPPQ